MKITPILTQLREQCPTLAHRVAAGFDLATLQAGTPVHKYAFRGGGWQHDLRLAGSTRRVRSGVG